MGECYKNGKKSEINEKHGAINDKSIHVS